MASSLFDLTGKVALVTGASRGLGAAAAEGLAEAGASVALIGRDLETLYQREEELRRYNTKTLCVVCDTSLPDQIARTAEYVFEHFGRIDILVNNAGIVHRAKAEEHSLEDWNKVIAINQTGVYLMAQEVGKIMIAQQSGKIINISSLLAFSGGLNTLAYTTSKHAVVGITRSMANEWARHGIQVNAIAPGYFETEATEALRNDPTRYKSLVGRIPAGRFAKPDELKGTIVYLASAASDYVTGSIVTVDGGWMAR